MTQTIDRRELGAPVTTSIYFLIFGSLIGASAYVTFIPANLRFAMKMTMVIAGLIAWVAAKRIERFARYTGLMRSFFSVALGLLLTYYISRFLPPHVIGPTASIAGVGKAKFFEALPIILTILIFHFASGGEPNGLFLKAGNVKFGLLAGGIGVALFLAIAAIQAIGSNLTWGPIWSVLPWILLFTLSNGLLEELWFRALFIKKLEPMIGARTTLVLTSFVFAVVHISSTYGIDIIQFVAVTFLLGLIWAWVMRKGEQHLAGGPDPRLRGCAHPAGISCRGLFIKSPLTDNPHI